MGPAVRRLPVVLTGLALAAALLAGCGGDEPEPAVAPSVGASGAASAPASTDAAEAGRPLYAVRLEVVSGPDASGVVTVRVENAGRKDDVLLLAVTPPGSAALESPARLALGGGERRDVRVRFLPGPGSPSPAPTAVQLTAYSVGREQVSAAVPLPTLPS